MSLKIFSASQIRAIDALTIIEEPIFSLCLMERASRAVFLAFTQEIGREKRISVFAGAGNNGGDAFAVARMLFHEGYQVKVYLVRTPKTDLSKDGNENMWRWRNLSGVFFLEICQEEAVAKIDFGDVVVDGLFGSGLNRPLTGIFESVVKAINASSRPVYSIDVPSGLFVEDNAARNGGPVVFATKVYTFLFPKLAFLLPENGTFAPDFEILDIGLSRKAIQNTPTAYYFLQQDDIRSLLHVRPRFSHKGTYGHALLVAGKYGQMGAAVIAAKACLRTGVGLLTLHCPEAGIPVLQTAVPEAMIHVGADQNGTPVLGIISPKWTVGIGPGIGKGKEQERLLEDLLQHIDKPLVVDADALNLLSENREWIKLLPKRSILTPHPTEFDRLVGKSFDTGYSRLQSARQLAKECGVIVVLKGAYTAVVFSDGNVYFNSTGNPGMATAGSGDCLTGIITSLLAQNYSPEEASCIGVYIHGLAGDLALQRVCSMESVLASDIIDAIGQAFSQIRK